MAAGVIFNLISKSGANQWHGAAYNYIENDAFNARSFFDPQKPRQRYDNYGGAVSGADHQEQDVLLFQRGPDGQSQSVDHYNHYAYSGYAAGGFRPDGLWSDIRSHNRKAFPEQYYSIGPVRFRRKQNPGLLPLASLLESPTTTAF